MEGTLLTCCDGCIAQAKRIKALEAGLVSLTAVVAHLSQSLAVMHENLDDLYVEIEDEHERNGA